MLNEILRLIYIQNLKVIILIMVCIVCVWTIFALLLYHYKKIELWVKINTTIFGISLIIILIITVFSRRDSVNDVELMPFYTIISAQVEPEYFRSFLMNIFLFMPLGLAMPYSIICFHNEKVVRYVIWRMGAFAISIEVLQFVLNLGRAETDDVISNLCGAFLGTISYSVYKRIVSKYEKQKLVY